ncbi:MAG TPA: ribosomal-processing cysteine protease Prp [Clostridia bacterium]|nr:ribosomal-processing cysteine protease Prp [Clostridia bacterium]
MIRATFLFDKEGRIGSFRMEGHARAWRPWPDEICAGMSAIAQTVIGSLQELAEVEPDYALEPANIRCSVIYPDDRERAAVIEILMNTARVGCLQIENSYGKRYVTVIDRPYGK